MVAVAEPDCVDTRVSVWLTVPSAVTVTVSLIDRSVEVVWEGELV